MVALVNVVAVVVKSRLSSTFVGHVVRITTLIFWALMPCILLPCAENMTWPLRGWDLANGRWNHFLSLSLCLSSRTTQNLKTMYFNVWNHVFRTYATDLFIINVFIYFSAQHILYVYSFLVMKNQRWAIYGQLYSYAHVGNDDGEHDCLLLNSRGNVCIHLYFVLFL